MKLRKLKYGCEHDRFEAHGYGCPGGVFLPDDAIVIEKVDGKWPGWAQRAILQTDGLSMTEVLDALSVREAE